MSQSIVPPAAVEYPSSDGQPMAETPVHRRCMTYLIDALERHLGKGSRRPACVSGNMFLYYEEGNPRAVVAPDVFVALGVPNRNRDTYLLWEESKGPDFVVEVTSRSTRREDQGRKREVYARLGVSEYFLYDPRADELRQSVQRGLARPSEDGVLIPLHPVVRTMLLLILGQLARSAGDRRGMAVHPATNWREAATDLLHALSRESMPS